MGGMCHRSQVVSAVEALDFRDRAAKSGLCVSNCVCSCVGLQKERKHGMQGVRRPLPAHSTTSCPLHYFLSQEDQEALDLLRPPPLAVLLLLLVSHS